MKDFFTSGVFKMFVTIVFIIVMISLFTLNFGNNFISSAINYMTTGLHTVTAAAADKEEKKSYDELLEENRQLEDEIAGLRTELVDYYDVKLENERLYKYYDLKKENPQYDLLPASVIRRDPNDNFYSFTADKGISDGISVNDPVVTEKGLIGYVCEADEVTCKIRTVLSPETSVSAIDKTSGDSGIIKGSVLYCDDNLTVMTQLSESNKVQKGDILTTSGIGGVYPANLIIGEVTDIKVDEFDSSRYAVVKPYENIKEVSDLVIITDFTSDGLGESNE